MDNATDRFNTMAIAAIKAGYGVDVLPLGAQVFDDVATGTFGDDDEEIYIALVCDKDPSKFHIMKYVPVKSSATTIKVVEVEE